MTDVEIVKFEPQELVTCDELLLADWMLKQYCDFINNDKINIEPLIKPETDLSQVQDKTQILSKAKQLVLARSCLADVIYSLHCLGLWCAKRTVKLYLTEFARLFSRSGDLQPGDLIGSTLTILNCVYSRLDELSHQSIVNSDDDDTILRGTTNQLKLLLSYLKDVEPPPNNSWPICIVHVRRKVIAKVIALWLNEVSNEFPKYSFIKPNYIVGSFRKYRNRMTVDNFDLHHEASIKDFRFGKCNTLVISTVNDRCADMLKCNFVVSFDYPDRFEEFLQAKTNCRFDSSKYVIMLNNYFGNDLEQRILNYMHMEKIYNTTNRRDILEQKEVELLKGLEQDFPPYPSGNKDSKNPATIYRSIAIINKYCTKLPSDSFTKLSPEWNVKEVEGEIDQYYCEVRLPINSPVRQAIIGPQAPTRAIAMRLAAFTACKVLHSHGELDNNMCPIKKESMKAWTPWLNTKEFARPKSKGGVKLQFIGSTKHRQYYRKRIARVFSGPLVSDDTDCYLYKFKMVLTCEIPEEQNRRGRRIIDPNETNRNYAIVCTTKLPKMCSFPVFTRSGEVMISVELIKDNFRLTKEQVQDLRNFHEYTFSKVLRLEKYPTIFKPENSPFTVLLAPVIDDDANGTQFDWDFVTKIVNSNSETFEPDIELRKKFTFNKENYLDAVVIPWYRLTDRQQFAYYVAEICDNMSPESPFPDEESGFETFIHYYESKYNMVIYNKDQPVLDVDHTSARLNLLTPRYVNRKGRTLPSSTAKTRKESRESLVQKQLLIPELCTIHPFPASFWRKAVCLPAIFYRLNSLFLAEELRREVAQEIKVGFVEPPEDFVWPELHFGWSLKDVIANQAIDDSTRDDSDKEKLTKTRKSLNGLCKPREKPTIKPTPPIFDETESDPVQSVQDDFVIDHFDPSKYDIPDIPLDAPAEEWMNIKLISTGPGQTTTSGWDQPIEQQDLFLKHSNEITWDDCEMDFDGELSEKPADVRCGSPSSFEPSAKNPGTNSYSSSKEDRINSSYDSSGKAVTFDTLIGDEDEDDFYDDNDMEDENCDNELVSKSNTNKKHAQTFDSDSSWSLSDDEDAEEDDVASCVQWQGDKSKKQSVLRELFVPYYKRSSDKFEQLERECNRSNINSEDKGDNESNLIDLIDKLKVTEVAEDSNLELTIILSKIFEEEIERSPAKEKKVLQDWYRLLNDLDTRVAQTLLNQPDLFKDNDVELVAVDDSLGGYDLEMQPAFGELLPNRDVDCNWSNEAWKNIKFDPTRDEIKSTGPGPSVILQALTMSNASDGINLERLETVGDSFLKYSITAYLYCTHLTMHEGKLSYLRSTEISNANLYRLGRSKNLGEIMSATKFEPNDNWLAPGYSVADNDQASESNSLPKKKEIDKALAEVPYDLLRQHSIPDKSIADCVEALIGAYLTASGSRAALLFMRWLGLRVVPPDFDIEKDIETVETDNSGDTIWRWLKVPPSPLICKPPSVDERAPKTIIIPSPDELKSIALNKLECLYSENSMDKFEQEIQYTFKDKAYLVQAFTHNSFHENHVTDCHQRLEFLGDALLDYLITRYLFEDPRCHSPGTLTDLRSALVNNTFFASLAVKYNFHKYLKFISDELTHVIEGFIKKFKFDSKDTITKGYTLLINEGESEYAEDIEVPKALGDVFESVAGAIYLDSGMSLDQVWQVYFKMMKPEIEYFSSHVPKSPIRELLESMPQNVRFSPSEITPDRKHRVTAEVFGLGRFTGVGRNKHSAKSTAAKRALRQLAKRKRSATEDKSNQETIINA
uniref:Endoribonuclease Dcr-1 n=2 Tax=Aceria tosichella TaxID=561515 RepID=A0A6G1SN96_9ACAR